MPEQTFADQFKAKRKEDYADPLEFFKIVSSVDPQSAVFINEAGNAEIQFSDNSTYIIGAQ